jgi:hypothetical protein
MVADLQTSAPNVKYVDDTTFAEICEKGKPSELQQTADKIIDWSKSNHLYINTSKTKELTISFGKKQELPHLIMDGKEIERVSETKLLGVIISDNLKWDAHVKFIVEKASKRLFYLRQLKYAGLHENELTRVYKALVRPVCEYACPVWSTHLPKYLIENIEAVQKRAMKIIKPFSTYTLALEELQLESLKERRDTLCLSFFKKLENPSDRLNCLIPSTSESKYNLSKKPTYKIPNYKTNRAKNSFIPWCAKKLNQQ